jgi:hypothetical protein
MPIFRIHSGFHPSLHEIRSPHGDERYVMDAYQPHSHVCHQCAVYRCLDLLCEQGIRLARNVSQYLYKKNGRFFAVIGHDYDKTIQAIIP